ncbi:unnamed protein product [Acanthoscelides obtectus]|uniref:Uncharacterized protein n=1 Tax=Acanthoscelides obtectus TaxID=200917 RepID=A0A9P0JSS4_ACAOB|nr:unnamed protein product [Acanthoscelides obtectus]CAK1661108.1 hypothetical protein AOBTE_LOCUS22444 [Acanthoscelides obtectus]
MFCTSWLILGSDFARAIISKLKKKELVFVKQERQVST